MIIKIKPRDIFKIAFWAYGGWKVAESLDYALGKAIVNIIEKHRKEKEEEFNKFKEEE